MTMTYPNIQGVDAPRMTVAEMNTASAIILATGQIVSAMQARGGDGGPIESLIIKIRKALTGPLEVAAPEVAPLVPAVPIRRSITPDLLFCLEDGKAFKSLKRHLRVHFSLTPEEYRAKWGLPADYPMVAPNYSVKRSQLAKDNGLGKKGAR